MLHNILTQTQKTPMGASFVLEAGNTPVGSCEFRSTLVVDKDWRCDLLGHQIMMVHRRRQDFFRHIEHIYEVSEAGDVRGELYYGREASIFKPMYYHQLTWERTPYRFYAVGFGKEGLKCPVLREDRQIGLVTKAPEVRNALHTFDVYAANDHDMLMSVLLTLNYYVRKYFSTGTAHSTSITHLYTTNRELLAKLDPAFMEQCRADE